MPDRLTAMFVVLVLAIGFVWGYRPDQSRYDRLHPSQSRQPASVQ